MADSGTSGRAARGGDGDLGELKADLAALRSEMASVVAAVKQLGETAVRTAKRQRTAGLERLTTEAETLVDEAADLGRDQLADLEARIRKQPLAAIGIAFVVGLLFGSMRR